MISTSENLDPHALSSGLDLTTSCPLIVMMLAREVSFGDWIEHACNNSC